MNNKERLIWVSVLILGAFFCDRKVSEIERLQTLDKHREISAQIQSDQIFELAQKIDEVGSAKYSEGFEIGKTQALIASINKDNLLEYSEGYHAALSQFDFATDKSTIYDMFLEALELNNQSSENYAELLEMLSKED